MVTIERAQTVRATAISYAIAKGGRSWAEDFASWVVVYLYRKGMCNFEWAWRDFMRETFGDTRTKPGKLKRSEMKAEELKPEGNDSEAPEENRTALDIANRFKLKGEDRMIFLLHFQHDWNQYELAELYGVKQFSIWKRIDAILKFLKDRGIERTDLC